MKGRIIYHWLVMKESGSFLWGIRKGINESGGNGEKDELNNEKLPTEGASTQEKEKLKERRSRCEKLKVRLIIRKEYKEKGNKQ